MKKVILIALLLFPFYSKAQYQRLGKTRCDVNIAFQDAKTPRVPNAAFPGTGYSDTFNTGKFEQTVCRYDNMEICTEVIKIIKASTLITTLKDFDADYIKADGQLMLKNTWVDQDKTFKVHLENWKGVNKVYLDYVLFDKGFMRK